MNAPLSTYHPDTLHGRLVELGETWAKLNGTAEMLEEGRKSILAELANQATGGVAERERAAYASDTYRTHVRDMVDARREANIARVHYDAAKVWVEMARTAESTRRAEMGLR